MEAIQEQSTSSCLFSSSCWWAAECGYSQFGFRSPLPAAQMYTHHHFSLGCPQVDPSWMCTDKNKGLIWLQAIAKGLCDRVEKETNYAIKVLTLIYSLKWCVFNWIASQWNSITQNKVHAVSARMESCFHFHFSHQVSALAVSTLSHTGIQELSWQDGYK